ncbi:hypothetical protein B7P43_G03883 [Cryptotermes secundus]|uniref:Uncharacterized protein n=1 Tax=Cryptotermes secundus TaxID=105785 RepID=A0A2J7QV77_9NEOP|nr:hypothetical protein B7P43_G03883 [Cryptotermes secundus]
MWILCPPDTYVVLVNYPTQMKSGFITENETFQETIIFHLLLNVLSEMSSGCLVFWFQSLQQLQLVRFH